MRILIIQPSSLGDVAQALPVVADIRAGHPAAVVDWVVEPAFAPLVRRVAGIGEVIEGALGRWRERWWAGATRSEWRAFKQRLRREAYDAVIDLQGSAASALAARAARGRSYGVANPQGSAAARWLVDLSIALPPRLHALDRARQSVARVLGGAVQGGPEFGLRREPSPAGERPVIVFAHGSAHPERLWADARWLVLGRRFVEAGWTIALPHGNELEQVRAEQLAAAIDSEVTAFLDTGLGAGAAVQVWPRLRLDMLLERLGAAHGVVGVDSGLARVAVALGLPVVQVYLQPNAWYSGPQRAHGRRHQLPIGGDAVPTVDEVWATWRRALAAADARDRDEAT